ncbi:MAG: hypothetical protein GX303_02590 [Clostridiales bacterium]|nr:hypothetical protein [Clostridiales bacterium]
MPHHQGWLAIKLCKAVIILSKSLKAAINGGKNGYHRYAEKACSDNEKTRGATANRKRDFGVWGFSVDSYDVYEKETIALTINRASYKSGSYSNASAQSYIGEG